MKLQHKTRRDGLVLVNGNRYDLDAEGCVEVSEQDGQKLLQGSQWAQPGVWKQPLTAPTRPPGADPKVGRPPRSREELLGLAEAAGVTLPEEALPPPAPEPEPVADEAVEEFEEIEVSSTMKKGELAKVAAKLGIDAGGKTKAQLLELINNYSED